jgi:hypothetical protein
MKNLCEQAFKEGLKERENHPLFNGIYKLENLRDWWEQRINKIEKIKDYKRGIGDPYSLNDPCMSDEIPSYLKELPEKLAYEFGYYIYPAVKALKGDGIDENSIKRIIDWRLGKLLGLIKDLEAIRIRLNKDIYYEFDNFKLNRSELSELHRQALDILYDIFEDIKEFKSPLDEDTENFQNEVLV